MHKIFFVITIGAFIFGGSLNETDSLDENSNPIINQYSWANDSSDDDYKVEARRRGGKHKRGDRRRGGSGLR